jgi:hypothetical protein
VISAVGVLVHPPAELAPDENAELLRHPHVGAVVTKRFDRVADRPQQAVVLTAGVGTALVGMCIVAIVLDLEEAGMDIGNRVPHAVDDLGHLAQVGGEGALQPIIGMVEAGTVVHVQPAQRRIVPATRQGSGAAVGDVLECRLR